MHTLKRSLILSLLGFILASAGWAQNAPDTGAALAGCGVCSFLIVGFIVLNIALLVWVARDAKARGMDSSVIWMILVMFTGVIGLIIYIFARPQGNMIQCAHCQNKRLQASAKCPHCGNA